ncbi:MAG: phosphorylase [Cyanobacteria bacterium P01_D01_bin.44]
MSNRLSWQPGTLQVKLEAQTQYALTTGALRSIATNYQFVEQDGIAFLVRILANLARKDAAKKVQKQQEESTGKAFNPFLPYEEDLYVTDISETHLCLLNKFNVVDHHLLIITRAFEAQETWLTLADFEALWKCMTEVDGFFFYNAGTVAGASQRHKHLQMVPLPMVNGASSVPMEIAVQSARFKDGIGRADPLLFEHAIAPLNLSEGSQSLLTTYQALLKSVSIHTQALGGKQWQGEQTAAYNLLGTRNWMMVVPRSQESYQAISVNSLGFAGSLLVKNAEKLSQLKEIGPMRLLEKVGKGR